MIDPVWRIAVVIPACNEELLLPRCLRSVLLAKKLVAFSDQVDIIVVCDRCTDTTAAIATDLLAGEGLVINCEAGAVGAARRLGTMAALTRAHVSPNRCWLANTDADCIVPPTWLNQQLQYARRGYEAVAGTVDVDNFDDHRAHVGARFRETYLIPSDDSHPHVHGANLGVTMHRYLEAGGWLDLPTGEDHDLWRRLCKTGAQRLSTSRTQVITSGRRAGRAPHGFADALFAHNNEDAA